MRLPSVLPATHETIAENHTWPRVRSTASRWATVAPSIASAIIVWSRSSTESTAEAAPGSVDESAVTIARGEPRFALERPARPLEHVGHPVRTGRGPGPGGGRGRPGGRRPGRPAPRRGAGPSTRSGGRASRAPRPACAATARMCTASYPPSDARVDAASSSRRRRAAVSAARPCAAAGRSRRGPARVP